jgi:hypothetical protein
VSWLLLSGFIVSAFNFGKYSLLSRGSSGSLVSDYGLDGRVIEVRSPTEAEDFSSSPCVRTGSGAHPASCTMGTGGPFPRDKARPGRDADHSSPTSAEVENESELYLLSPHAPPWRVAEHLYLYSFFTFKYSLLVTIWTTVLVEKLIVAQPG